MDYNLYMEKYNVEKEYKMMLSDKQFNLIVNDLKFDKVNIQINHYYTCPNHMGMRVRELDGQYIFTLKRFINNEVREYEWVVEDLSLNDKRIQNLFKELKIDSYRYLGELKTTRYLKYYALGELCLDLNEYLGLTDYELEYELKDAKHDDFDNLVEILNHYDIEFKTNKITKYKRFNLRLEELKCE